jgi:hypothetical protein
VKPGRPRDATPPPTIFRIADLDEKLLLFLGPIPLAALAVEHADCYAAGTI